MLIPRFNIVRRHTGQKLNGYYGIGFGSFGHLVGGHFTIYGLSAIEYRLFHLECSISHMVGGNLIQDDEPRLQFTQTHLNTKLGVRLDDRVLRIGISYIMNEQAPEGKRGKGFYLDFSRYKSVLLSTELLLPLKSF